jgi:hypothetical protein
MAVSSSTLPAMVNVTVSLPDDLASRAEAAAAERGVTVDELASEAIEAYVGNTPNGQKRSLSFIALGDGPDGFSAREAEERLEDEGFEPSRSS